MQPSAVDGLPHRAGTSEAVAGGKSGTAKTKYAGIHMDGTSDANQEAELFQWAALHGTKINHQFMMVDFVMAGGRGAAACSDIPKDAEVMEMPTSLFFGLTPLGGHPVLGDVATLDKVLSILKANDPDTHTATTWQM